MALRVPDAVALSVADSLPFVIALVIALVVAVIVAVGFAIIVGLLVGTVVLYGLVRGSVGSVGFVYVPTLLVARFIPVPFMGMMAIQLIALLAILLGATLLPILIEAYTARYDTSILR